MKVTRIDPKTGLVKKFSDIEQRIKEIETKPSGEVVIRDSLRTYDPVTGVETILGTLPDGSNGFQPFVGDVEPPPVATPPIATEQPGTMTVYWDGAFVAGAEQPKDFQHVNVLGHKVEGGTVTSTVFCGVIRLPNESVIVTTDVATVGDTWKFSFTSEDYNKNLSVPSEFSPTVTMQSAALDSGIIDAIEAINSDIILASSAAASAQQAANTAQGSADDAAQAALDAANAAEDAADAAASKGKVIIQSAAPDAADRLPQNLWIDTTGGANVPKRWVSGTTWTAVTDKVATDAAAAAVAAQNKADQAFNNAANAASAAGTAQSTADGKNRTWNQPTKPAGTSHKEGDSWYDTDDGNKLYLWKVASNDWIPFQDGAISSLSVAVTGAQATADGKNTNYYETSAPTNVPVGKLKKGDTWFDLSNSYRQSTWTGSAWQITQDAALAKLTADSKGITYTQAVTPPVSARLPQNLWIDTSLGANQAVTKFWDPTANAGAGAWIPVSDKGIKTAQDTADAKGETIFSTTEPAVAKRLPQNVWVDTTGGLNINKRWDGNAWVVVVDSRIPSTAVAVTAADAKAQTAINDASTKGITYTQSTTPPVSARLPQNIWNDTSLGLDKVVVKYWDGNAWTSIANKSATDAQTAADVAMQAQAYSTNASFDNWTGTTPVGFSQFGSGTAVKETSIVRRAPFAARFNLSDSTTQQGFAFSTASILSHAPNLEYFTVEVDLYLVSGTLNGSGMILDWAGMTNNRTQINFVSAISSATTGKWYRVSQVLRRPTNATGTWTGMSGYLMGQWSGHGTGAAKNIIFDWFNIRPSTTEEILAYNAPADAQAKSDAAVALAATDAANKAAAAQAAAISAAATDATTKANTAQSNAISTAATDAQTKATAAQNAATAAAAADATSKAAAAQAAATAAAATDAQNKANAAKQDAIDAAATHAQLVADGAEQAAIDAAASDAASKAAAAQAAAITAAAADATSKANAAQAAATAAAATDAQNKATQAKNDAISWASDDATEKATAAQIAATNAAAADAASKAATAQANATAAAATDAQNKADAAKQEAIDAAAITAQLKANGAQQAAIDAAATDAQNKANAAQTAAINAAAITAQAKADAAQAAAVAAAATDAQTKATQAKNDAINAAATDATTKSDAAQLAAIQAQGYSVNPSFDDWTGTYPVGYAGFNTAPTKELSTIRTGKIAARFNCTDTTTQRGLTAHTALVHAPDLEYYTVELEVRLNSGTSFGGSGVLLDWAGMTNQRVTLSLATEIPTPITGKWYRVVKVLRRPTNATGTWTAMNAWLMGQYSSGMGTTAVKDLIVDWFNIRPSTTEEITSYGTPASITSLTNTVNTKAKVWFGGTQPSLVGNTAGDQWFDTANGNKIYVFVGNATTGTWTLAQDATIPSLSTAVTAAQATANGKNKVTYSTSNASGANTAGDIWFKLSGSSIVAQWQGAGGTTWNAVKVDGLVIANIDAGTITVGTMNVNRITMGDFTNAVDDPDFTYGTPADPSKSGWNVSGQASLYQASVGPDGQPTQTLRVIANGTTINTSNKNSLPVRAGETYYGSVYVKSDNLAPTGQVHFGTTVTLANGAVEEPLFQEVLATTVTGSWRKLEGVAVMPVGAVSMVPRISVRNSVPNGTFYWDKAEVRRQSTAVSIADGTITANSAIIANGAIGTAHIANLAVDTAKINNAAVKTAQIDNLAVTDAKIANINAEKLTAGIIAAERIGAGTIKADKLNVTLGGENLVYNSSFEVDTDSNGLADGWLVWTRGTGDAGRTFACTRPAGLFPGSTFTQRVQSNNVGNTEQSSLQSTTLMSIGPSVSATISVYGRASVAGNYSVSLRCEDDTAAYRGDANFVAAFTTTGQRFVGTVVTPAGTTKAKVTITGPNGISSGHWFEVDGVKVELGDMVSAWGPNTAELLPGTITGTFLSATAIDGKTITGAIIQTEVTANRGIKLTGTELAGYDGAGVKNFSLTSGGTLAIKGTINSGSTISGATLSGAGIETTTTPLRGVKLTNTGITTYDSAGNMTFKVDASTGLVEAPGIKANSISGTSLAATAIDGKTITGALVQTETTASRGIKLTTTELAGWDNAGTKNFSLSSAGVLAIRGAIQSGSTIDGTTITGSTGIQTSTGATSGVKMTNSGIVAYDGSNNMTFRVNATTGEVEAPGLKANSIKGDMIEGGSVTADKLVIGDFTNMVVDPYMTGTGKINSATYVTATSQTVSAGAPFERLAKLTTRDSAENPVQYRPVTPGDVFYVEAWVRADAAATKDIRIGFWSQSDDGTNHWNTTSTMLPSGSNSASANQGRAGWVKLQGTFVVPAIIPSTTKVPVRGRPWININGTTGVETTGWYVTGWNARRQVGATIIQDGTITTEKVNASGINGGAITAGTLTALQMKGKSVTADKLLITSTDNLIQEGDFSGSGLSWMLAVDSPGVAGVSINGTAGRNSLPALIIQNSGVTQTTYNAVGVPTKVAIENQSDTGTAYRVSMWVKATVSVPVSGVQVVARFRSTTGATTEVNMPYTVNGVPATMPTAGTYYEITGIVKAPTGSDTISVAFGIRTISSFSTGTVTVDNISVTRASNGELVVDGSIKTQHLSAGNIDAAVLSAGSIKAAQIGGKVITTDKLVVSSTDNLILEADFSNNGSSWGLPAANLSIVSNGGRGNGPALRVTGTTSLVTINNVVNKIPVGQEDRFRGSLYVKSSVAAPSGTVKLRMNRYTTPTTSTPDTIALSPALPAGVWTLVEGYSNALPTGTIAIEFFIEAQNAASGTTLDFDYVAVTRAADGKLVVDGAIDGKIITGATFRTGANVTTTGGIQFDPLGFRAYNPAGQQTFNLSAATGNMDSTGYFSTTGSQVSGAEGGGTMAIGATFGTFTYNSHTDFTGVPGIKFSRVHSSQGAKTPASIYYDGQAIRMTTGDLDSGFTPNSSFANADVGHGGVSLWAIRSGATVNVDTPTVNLSLYNSELSPGTEGIDAKIVSKYSDGESRTIGVEINGISSTGFVRRAYGDGTYQAALVNRSNQLSGTKLGYSVMEVGDAGVWNILGKNHAGEYVAGVTSRMDYGTGEALGILDLSAKNKIVLGSSFGGTGVLEVTGGVSQEAKVTGTLDVSYMAKLPDQTTIGGPTGITSWQNIVKTTLTFGSPFGPYAGFATPTYWRDAIRVSLSGVVGFTVSSATLAAGTTYDLGSIPSSYAPDQNILFSPLVGPTMSPSIFIYVMSTGAIRMYSPTTQVLSQANFYVGLDGMSWLRKQ